ncbi:unnamed protein product [Penicillium bialowiezense]
MTPRSNPTGPLGSSEVDSLEDIPGFRFTDLRYLDSAVENAGARSTAECKKRLAQLADAVIRRVQAYQRHKATVSKQHDTWATNAVLAEQGYKHGIDAFIRRERSDSSGSVGITLTATVVEALIGAVYKDSGNDMDYVRKAIAGLGLSSAHGGDERKMFLGCCLVHPDMSGEMN